jgi:hypothetical protein
MHCGIVGPAAVCAYPDGGGPLLALCPACARDSAHVRALIRALGLGTECLGHRTGVVES